jgi:hypothetical protein
VTGGTRTRAAGATIDGGRRRLQGLPVRGDPERAALRRLHRFIPVLATWNRFRITEIVVDHHPRKFGRSKYGFRRSFEGLTDLLTVTFLSKYDRKPSHFFAMLGGLLTFADVVICAYLTVLKLLGEAIGHRPLLLLGVLIVVIGMQVLASGLFAELLVHVAGRQPPYSIRRCLEAKPRETREADIAAWEEEARP